MKPEEFLKMCEEHYQLDYSNLENKFTIKFLNDNQYDLKKLFSETIQKHSKKWRVLPDIAIFAEIIKPKKDLTNEAAAVFANIVSQLDSYKDFQTGDKRIYAGMIRCGEWDGLCRMSFEDMTWKRKDFIDGYCGDIEGIEPRRFKGIGNGDKCICIGEPIKEQIENAEIKSHLDYVMAGIGK